MKRLKKWLSLILCLVLSLSLMIWTAGAAFTDDSRIEHKQAVALCSELGIINGMPDGSYQPQKNVTRAQMSKMICVALNGGKDPKPSVSNHLEFQDIVNHWAAPYIQMCADRGIVAGVGGGRFNPDGSVTGTQAAKMLLTALGYDQTYEEYVGPQWSVNVNTQADDIQLYQQINAAYNRALPLSRDNAAQMIANTLWAFEVDYDLSGAHGSGPVAYNLGRTFLDAHFTRPPPSAGDSHVFESVKGEYTHRSYTPNDSTLISLSISPDGTFYGTWQRTNQSLTGANHPNGTIWAGTFKGEFLRINHVTPYRDFMYIKSIELLSPSTPRYEDGCLIQFSLPPMLCARDLIDIYHQGTPLEEMLGYAPTWISLEISIPSNQKLPLRVLYNSTQEYGFLAE